MTPSREAIEAAARVLAREEATLAPADRIKQLESTTTSEPFMYTTEYVMFLEVVTAFGFGVTGLLIGCKMGAEQILEKASAEVETLQKGDSPLGARDETIKALVEALEKIARQKTNAELGDDGPFGSNYDFAEGYDCCVMRARAALALVRKGCEK